MIMMEEHDWCLDQLESLQVRVNMMSMIMRMKRSYDGHNMDDHDEDEDDHDGGARLVS